jgi:hypothetical protein
MIGGKRGKGAEGNFKKFQSQKGNFHNGEKNNSDIRGLARLQKAIDFIKENSN